MPWTHIVTPNVGLVTNVAPVAIPPGASPSLTGVYLKDGQVITDYGFVSFPTSSNTQSNLLNGTVMAIYDFNLSSGIEYLCALTTTCLYVWNTQTLTWDLYSQGTVIDTADSAWTGEVNVTTTADATIFIRGSHSSKNIIASAFTTGIVSYHNFSSLDISATNLNSIAFWFYSTVSLASDVLRLRVSAQNAGGTSGVYADYSVPAITLGQWTHCVVTLATPIASSAGFTPSALSAVLSVALVASVDPGTVTVYIDDIQAVQCFTGNEDNRFSIDSIYDTMLITNGMDAPSQLISSGGPMHSTASLSLPSGAITTSEVVRCFKDHVLWFNNTENGASKNQRATWSNIGTITDYVDGTSGYQDMTDNDQSVVAAEIFSENLMLVYKSNSVVACSWVGGAIPFRFDPLIYNYGAISKDAVALVEGYHIAMDGTDIYVNNGTSTPQILDAQVKNTLYGQLSGDYSERVFIRYNQPDDEIEFYICYQDTTPDLAYVFNPVDQNWSVRSRNINCWGQYQTQSFLTIGELIGTISQQTFTFGSQVLRSFFPITLVGSLNGVYQINKSSILNGSNAIVSSFQTPDFVSPSSAEVAWSGGNVYQNQNMRISELAFEAMGTSITVQYSLDGGMTWSPCQGGSTNIVTLTSSFAEYELFFETDAKKIRFQFSGGPFALRYYGFLWNIRTGRR